MKTLLSIVAAVLIISSTLLAQGYEFRVMINKGPNKFRSSGSDWTALKAGVRLQKGDDLQIADGGYIGLVHNSGRTLEFKEPGDHKITDLAAKLGSGTSVANKYVDFVLNKMAPEKREENRRKYASVTGAVERATDDAGIKVLMPTSADIYSPEAIIAWIGDENQKYQVTIKNMFDEVIMSEQTNNSWYKVNFDAEKLSKERLVIFNVSLADNKDVKSGDYGIKRLSADEAQKFEGELNDLKSNLDEESSLNKLILAEFFEQNKLLIDANTNYVLAMQLSPDVEYFKEVYDEFKMRNGLGK